jgi:tRNA pseudouridine38-40 synthase
MMRAFAGYCILCCWMQCILVNALSVGMGLTRYNARVMYDGTNYRGWQDVGNKVNSIQKTISDHLSTRLVLPVQAVGASRTDAGVHARGQAMHFDVPTDVEFNLEKFEYQMNRLLPPDIRILNVSTAPSYVVLSDDGTKRLRPWHAIGSARRKHYSYTFTLNNVQDPIRRNFVSMIRDPIDIAKLRDALKIFVGRHDFVAFTNVARTNMKSEVPVTTWRTIDDIVVREPNEHGEYKIDIFLHSALYKMLRNVVWSGITVAAKDSKYTKDDIATLLREGKGRIDNWSRTAPAHGLCLERVYYDDY